MRKPWFKAKEYGWGWYPATWQGWLVMAVWLVLAVWMLRGIDATAHSTGDFLLGFFPKLILLTVALMFVSWRTGERPQWRWAGEPASPPVVLLKTIALVVGVGLVVGALGAWWAGR